MAGLNSADELEEMLNIEQQVYSTTFRNYKKEELLEMLNKQNYKRIINLVMLIRKQIFNSSDFQSENVELIQSYKDRIKALQGKYNSIQSQFSEIKIELEDKNDLYNKLVEKNKDLFQQIQMFKGNEKILKGLSLEQLNDFEEDAQKLTRVISKIKSEVFFFLYS